MIPQVTLKILTSIVVFKKYIPDDGDNSARTERSAPVFQLCSQPLIFILFLKLIVPLKYSSSHCRSVIHFFASPRGGPTLYFLGMCPLELRRHTTDSIHLLDVIFPKPLKPFHRKMLQNWFQEKSCINKISSRISKL